MLALEFRFPQGRAILKGKKGRLVNCSDALPWAVQKWLNQSRCHFGIWTRVDQTSMYYVGCTLAPPGEFAIDPSKPKRDIFSRTCLPKLCQQFREICWRHFYIISVPVVYVTAKFQHFICIHCSCNLVPYIFYKANLNLSPLMWTVF